LNIWPRMQREKLEYVLDSGARIVYPKGLLGEFLKEIYLELFGRRRNISWILEGIAGRDVRRALEMFVSILNSGHLSEEAITSNVRGAKSILIQERLVLKILMRTEYRFFSKGSGFITTYSISIDDWENGITLYAVTFCTGFSSIERWRRNRSPGLL